MRARWPLLLSVLAALPVVAGAAADAGVSGAATAPAGIRKLEPAQFRAALEKARASGRPFTLLDVREPSETAAGYVAGAELMPYTSGVFASEHGKISKDRPVLLYCASGRRAGRAAEMLVAEGWKDVTVLSSGGYEDLRTPARD